MRYLPAIVSFRGIDVDRGSDKLLTRLSKCVRCGARTYRPQKQPNSAN